MGTAEPGGVAKPYALAGPGDGTVAGGRATVYRVEFLGGAPPNAGLLRVNPAMGPEYGPPIYVPVVPWIVDACAAVRVVIARELYGNRFALTIKLAAIVSINGKYF